MEEKDYYIGDLAKDRITGFEGVIAEIRINCAGEFLVLQPTRCLRDSGICAATQMFPVSRTEILERDPCKLIEEIPESSDEPVDSSEDQD